MTLKGSRRRQWAREEKRHGDARKTSGLRNGGRLRLLDAIAHRTFRQPTADGFESLTGPHTRGSRHRCRMREVHSPFFLPPPPPPAPPPLPLSPLSHQAVHGPSSRRDMPAILLQPTHPSTAAYDPRLLYHPPLDHSQPGLMQPPPFDAASYRLSYPYTRFLGHAPAMSPMFPQWAHQPAVHAPPVPAPAPVPTTPQVPQRVWILDCKSCGMFLTNRGMKVSSPPDLHISPFAHPVTTSPFVLACADHAALSSCLTPIVLSSPSRLCPGDAHRPDRRVITPRLRPDPCLRGRGSATFFASWRPEPYFLNLV